MGLKKEILPFFQVFLIIVVAVACAGPVATPTSPPTDTATPTSTPTPTTPKPTAQRITSPNVPRADLSELVAGNNAFAFDLYQELRSGETNLIFSPYSISQALAMTYAGARGQTAQQMADTLHLTLDQDRLHPAFNALDLELASGGHSSVQDVSSGQQLEQPAFQLNIANAIWGRQGHTFLPEYLNTLAQNYGADVQQLDFTEPVAASDRINRWVSEQTDGQIPNIIPPGGISPEQTALILTNAIYFNVGWKQAFRKAQTNHFINWTAASCRHP
jgi:serpin B